MWSVEFWKAVADRAIRTFAWTLLSTIGVGYANLGDVPWLASLSAAGLATVLSVLAAVTVNKATGTGPSLTSAEQVVVPRVNGRHERPYL